MSDGVSAIISVYAQSKKLGAVAESLSRMEEVVDVYEVTGESDIIVLVKAPNISEFRNFTKDKLLKIDGIRNVVSSMVLYTHKKDGQRLK